MVHNGFEGNAHTGRDQGRAPMVFGSPYSDQVLSDRDRLLIPTAVLHGDGLRPPALGTTAGVVPDVAKAAVPDVAADHQDGPEGSIG